jgi:hypothetical protein
MMVVMFDGPETIGAVLTKSSVINSGSIRSPNISSEKQDAVNPVPVACGVGETMSPRLSNEMFVLSTLTVSLIARSPDDVPNLDVSLGVKRIDGKDDEFET